MDSESEKGETALFLAVDGGHFAVVDALLGAGKIPKRACVGLLTRPDLIHHYAIASLEYMHSASYGLVLTSCAAMTD